ncbi:MAG: glycosyltransferase family 4 protein [Methylobacterium sp.]|uniref:glycosyltransferase family 4 protein n=1 Tax=Methylobacterium sp. TaxID=409 RepID=UPI0025DFB251|nr:glycosyltransferase family 4 protein [Methylobacterium sp.]MBX9930360.1 glycosyltransferase family 4 protein [Methylobacterium sp.]
MTDPLRVLCVTPSGPEGRGGIDRLYHYLREAAPDGLAGIDLRYAAARGEAGALWPLAFPLRLLRVARVLQSFRPQVVHINFANRGSAWRKYAVLRLARAFGARIVVHLHDSLPVDALKSQALAGRLFLAICRGADRVVALGEASARALVMHGVATEKVRVVLNGIPDFAADIALPKPVGDDVVILLAGRVGTHKGVGILIDALSLLHRRGLGGWRCVIAGDGEVEDYAERAVLLGLSEHVYFTGWIEADGVHSLMRQADIVVLPSVAEALPLSLAEGACAGAALVATPVGNVPEILRNGVNGRLVTRDPIALAEALTVLIEDRGLLGRMQLASRMHYRERLTLDAFASNLAAIYAEFTALPGTESATGRGPGPSAPALPGSSA